MTALFEPKGEKPEWRVLYDDLLEGMEPGQVVSFADLDRVLGRPFSANRGPLYRARKELGAARHRWLEAVPGAGYRVIDASEHVRVARSHKRKGQRQLHTAVTVLNATDVGRLTEPERDHFDTQSRLLHALHFVAVQHEARISRIENALREGGML